MRTLRLLAAGLMLLWGAGAQAQTAPSFPLTYPAWGSTAASGTTVSGTGVVNRNAYWTGATTLAADSNITDNGAGLFIVSGTGQTTTPTLYVSGSGGMVGIGKVPNATLDVGGVVNSLGVSSTGRVSVTSISVNGSTAASTGIGISNGNVSFSSSFGLIFGNTNLFGTSTGVGIGTGSVGAPSVALQVSGTTWSTNYISTSAWVNVGSPTTLPTCNSANKGNVFMNTTTNCLNYCDGTSNKQVTSVAAGCT